MDFLRSLAFLVLTGSAVAQGPDWVVGERKITAAQGGSLGQLEARGSFGSSLCSLPDLDGDGNDELVVGAPYEDGVARPKTSWGAHGPLGAIRILFLDSSGSVRNVEKIRDPEGRGGFGWSVAPLGDLNGDGVGDLAVGAPFNSSGGAMQGAVWVLFLRADGRPIGRQKINELAGSFTGALGVYGRFGSALAPLGDVDGDGVGDLAVGEGWDASYYTWECTEPGAFWILLLRSDGTVKAQQKITPLDLGVGYGGLPCRYLGASLAALGDVDGDGCPDLAAGMPGDGPHGEFQPALLVVFLQCDGTVKAYQRIDEDEGGFGGAVGYYDGFAWTMGTCGDLDGDGLLDLAVGAPWTDDGGLARGAAWVLFLGPDGMVRRERRISSLSGGFAGPLDDLDEFGGSIAGLGDIDGDGLPELAVGAPGDDDGSEDAGAAWVLSLAEKRRRFR